MTTTMMLRVGDEVDLTVTWGTQQRNKCPNCLRYLPQQEDLTCRCGAAFERRPNGRYRVVQEPR